MDSLAAFLNDGDLPSFLGNRTRKKSIGRVGDSLVSISYISSVGDIAKFMNDGASDLIGALQTDKQNIKDMKEEFDKLLTTEAAPWVILNSLKKAKDAAIWIFKDPKSGSFVLCMGALGYLATQRDFSQRSKDDFFKRDTVSDLAFSADAIQLSLQDFDGLRNGFLYAQGVISSKINPSNFQANIVSNGKDSLLKLLSDIDGIFLGDLLETQRKAQRYQRSDDYITNIPGLYILSNLWYYAESY